MSPAIDLVSFVSEAAQTASNASAIQRSVHPAENQNLFEQNHQGKITLTRTVNKMPQVARPVATLI